MNAIVRTLLTRSRFDGLCYATMAVVAVVFAYLSGRATGAADFAAEVFRDVDPSARPDLAVTIGRVEAMRLMVGLLRIVVWAVVVPACAVAVVLELARLACAPGQTGRSSMSHAADG